MYVCMYYVCMYVSVSIYLCVCMCVFVYVCMCVRVYVYVCMYMCVCTFVYLCRLKFIGVSGPSKRRIIGVWLPRQSAGRSTPLDPYLKPSADGTFRSHPCLAATENLSLFRVESFGHCAFGVGKIQTDKLTKTYTQTHAFRRNGRSHLDKRRHSLFLVCDNLLEPQRQHYIQRQFPTGFR